MREITTTLYPRDKAYAEIERLALNEGEKRGQ